MKNLITQCKNITSVATITLWCCLAQADDIEVYRGGAVGGSPVALLVIDTSGSMREQEVVRAPDYDPLIDYKSTYKTGPYGKTVNYQFQSNLYYFSNDYAGDIILQHNITDLLARPFPTSALVCLPATSQINTAGSYTSEFKRWNSTAKVWEPNLSGTSTGTGGGTGGSTGSGTSSGTGSHFDDYFGNYNSFDDFFFAFDSFKQFKKKFKKYRKKIEKSFDDNDDLEDKFEDSFEDTFNLDFDVIDDFEHNDKKIKSFDKFKGLFKDDFNKFKNFFNNAAKSDGTGNGGGNSGGNPGSDTPNGNPTDTSTIVECKSDEGTHPLNKFTNTNASVQAQYVDKKEPGYEDEWDVNFKHIYHGNFLNYKIYSGHFDGDRTLSRMEITVDAAKHMVNTTGGINLGLSSFNYKQGGRIDVAADDIDTIRPNLLSMLDTYDHVNWTPLSEGYYEAARYLQGETPLFGKNSTQTAIKNGRYASPINTGCQSTSNIVLFTDGEPTYDKEANTYIESLIKDIDFSKEPGLSDRDRSVLSNNCSDTSSGAGTGQGSCAEELAYYLANYDQRHGPGNEGKQTIITHTIGGFFDESADSSDKRTLEYMEDIARLGGGTYAAASSKQEIIDSFKAAVTVIMDKPVTFVAPSVAANSYNSLEHLDQLYYAMFVPSADNNWKGNLKSYRLSPDGLVVDADGYSAIDATSGLFKEASRSYWTADNTTDGGKVTKGGAAGKLKRNNNIFTNIGSKPGTLTQKLSTTLVSKTKLGLPASASDDEHAAAIDWLNRKTPQGGDRQEMEDPLHSRPLVVNYGYEKDTATGKVTTKGVVFVGTNSGYLHAFNADKHNFKEYFSFIPEELLSNGNLYRTKDENQPKAYGIDGPMNYWHVDKNQDLQVNADKGEKVYLFFGLRRGGRHYYALDVTDPAAPKFQWKISGGQGGDFDNLGQSWSPMTLAKVKWGDKGKTKVVLLVGGGYDPDEDNRDSRSSNSMGNSIYMIEPETGKLLWSASNSNADTNLPAMTSAITSEVKAVDFDGDQVSDYFFVSDLGGRVWRFDINSNNEEVTKSNFISGAGVIFDANQEGSTYQRFYDAPSVSYFSNTETKEKFLTISIGSGYRAAPLRVGERDTKDSFYIIKDSNITSPPSKYKSPLYTTFEDITSTTQSVNRKEVQVWKFDLADGEKVLSTPLTSNGNIFFTTFSPSSLAASSNSCNAELGSSRVYTIDFIGYGKDLSDTNASSSSTSPVISSISMPNIGIPPQVIELNTTKSGQKLFCEKNPDHPSCEPPACEETGTCPDECESTGSVILSGTHVVGGSTLRCDLLKKNYWRSL